MWNEQTTPETTSGGHQLGKVTGRSGAAVQVQGETDYKSLPLAGPYGITWMPPNDAVAVVLSSNVGNGQKDICVGAQMTASSIQPGELLLKSTGGASIYLKNNGDVVINGHVYGGEG